MLTDYFVNVPACERLRHGIAGVYLDDFTDWLAGRGYAKPTIYSYVYAAVRFLTWAHTSGCEEGSALSWKSLTDYRTHLTASHHREKRAYERGNAYCGARRFVVFLRQRGLAPAPDVRADEPLHRVLRLDAPAPGRDRGNTQRLSVHAGPAA